MFFRIGTIVLLAFIVVSSVFAQSQFGNSISGFIFDDKSRNPIPEIFVELLDDNYSSLKRMKTDGSGRFFFGGLSSGNFKVRVLPYGTNYLEEVQEATIVNYGIRGATMSDRVYLDIYLKLDKRKINIDNSSTIGVVFVQEIPVEATNFYKKALSNFGRSKEEESGFENMKKALSIFPDYYEALNRISLEYTKRSKYYESLPYLVRAVNVNQRSFSCFYMLGNAAFNLKQVKEATEAFKTATVLNPDSIYANIQYGMVLRINGNDADSEKFLLKAILLSKDFPVASAFWQLGLLYNKLNRFDEAANQLEKYLKAQPDLENREQVKDLIAKLKIKAAKKK